MISRRISLSSHKSRLQRLEDRRLLASDLAVDLISDVPDTAYFSRAVPVVTLDAAQVVEPVGGSRPTESGEGQLNIEIIPGLKLRSSPAAMAAVERAAAQWEAHLFDPITVSIEIDFDGTSGGVLGFAIPTEVILPYSEVRAAMQVDGLAETDDSIVERLPDADSLDFALPTGTEFLGDISIAKANAKALNLRTSELDDLFGVADGGIVMSESVSFDFNNADGVEAGQVDFESVVVHEIGHILGFLSSVDRFTTDAVPDTIQPSTLDLFRFRSLEGADNPRSPAGFEAIQREMRPSTPAAIDFILQDGWDLPAEEYPVELGEPANVLPPDIIPFGYQASHWQDSDLFGETIGVMAPTIPPQTVVPISNIDLRAMDLIGYDVLPPDQVASVPELNDDQAVMNGEDRIVLDVLANDRNDDLPFQLSTFQIVDPPLLGEVTLDPVTGLVVYEVDPGTGDDFDIFTYTVANSEGIYGDPAIVEITISGVGERPIVIDDFVLTRQNQSIEFNPLANDTDDGELVLSNLAIESGPNNGTAIITSDGLRYTPSTDFIGNDTFDYSITDGDGLRSEGTVEITVGDTLIPPVVPGEPLNLLQCADVNGDQSISALDALLTINYLNRRASATTQEGLSVEAQQLDVSGDGSVTAVDALIIINLLNESDASGEPIRVPISDHSIHDGLAEEDELVGDDAGALF
ncbi:MAG: NF038122 family metalloprotease [Rhodopirellula sp. JB053]